jgi:hypothetical protein
MGSFETTLRARGYRRAWVVDTEYCSYGNHPRERCLCALDLLSGERREVWLAGVKSPPCPFEMAADECFIFFAADADVGIFLASNWPLPRHVIDPRVEFMRVYNGARPLPSWRGGDPDLGAARDIREAKKRLKKPGKYSLKAIAHLYKIPFISDGEKGEWRHLAMRREDAFTPEEQTGLLTYCRGDVDTTAEVARRIWIEGELSDPLTFTQALWRGFFMVVSAWVTHVGLPINVPLYRRLALNAPTLRAALIAEYARPAAEGGLDVFEDGVFKQKKLGEWIKAHGLSRIWPRTPSGQFSTERATLERMSHPAVDKLLAFRANIDLLENIRTSFDAEGEIEGDPDKIKGLMLCPDGRNRAPLFPFGTKTGRNAQGPKALFPNPAWMRHLICPEKGRAVAYLDYVTQEPRIAAARSRDKVLAELCRREDFHIAMAIACGVAPPGATKAQFKAERRIGKTLGLAMMFGGGPPMLMRNAGVSRGQAMDLLRAQRKTLSLFYAWSDAYAYKGLCGAPLFSLMGWRFWPRYWPRGGDPPDRTCRNFPVQSVGSDIMHVAGCLALLAGIRICAIVHDAFVIEAAVEDIERVTEQMRAIMEEAARLVIGVTIPAKPYIVRHGEQFVDEDGEEDFAMLMSMLEALEAKNKAA